MMTGKKFIVTSNYDGLPLQGIVCEPGVRPRGIVQLVHGMCEHKKRYVPLMRFLAANGYIVACYDHRGHGESAANEDDLGWFNDPNGEAVVEDCVQVTEYLKKEYPNLPVILFGHSMGSMVVRCYLREHDDLIDKLIVCGSPARNPLAGIAVALASIIGLFKGQRHRSKLLHHLSIGKGGEDFAKAGKGSWLTHDEEVVKAYQEDPYCGFNFTVNGFKNLFKLMKRTYTKRGYQVKNPNLPILFVSGGDDVVLGGEKNWDTVINFTRKVGYQKVVGKLYKDMRHEIHGDLCREEMFADLLRFIG
ncbi:MAG: alpha/beta hydrolase [Clostridiales bacterium]|nr:alpha/beta hydrolase [Clostridiales bacterium]